MAILFFRKSRFAQPINQMFPIALVLACTNDLKAILNCEFGIDLEALGHF